MICPFVAVVLCSCYCNKHLRTQILLQKAEPSIKQGTDMTDHTPRGLAALC